MGVQQQPPLVSKTRAPKPVSEARRIRKPLMERKRRERINTSLNDLARLLTEAHLVNAEAPGKQTKLEKADILELTVKHLKDLKTQQVPDGGDDKQPEGDGEGPASSYKEGFTRCMGVVEQTLSKAGKEALRERLLTHLKSCLKTLQPPTPRPDATRQPSEDAVAARLSGGSGAPVTSTIKCEASVGIKQESAKGEGASTRLTLVPTRLPTGGVAFLVQGGIDPSLLLPQEGKTVEVSTSPVPPQCPDTPSTPTSDQCPSASPVPPPPCPPTSPASPTHCPPTSVPVSTPCPPTSMSVSTQCPPPPTPTTVTPCLPASTTPTHNNYPPSTSISTQCPSISTPIPHLPPTSTQCSPILPHLPHTTTSMMMYYTPAHPTAHTPPTPPPSVSPQTFHPPPYPGQEDMEMEEDKDDYEEDIDIEEEDEPYDLSMRRMWRPW